MILWWCVAAALAEAPEAPTYTPPPVYDVPVLPLVTAEGLPLPDPLDPAWRAELVTADGLPLPDFERHGAVRNGPRPARVLGVIATMVTVGAVLVPAYAMAVDSTRP